VLELVLLLGLGLELRFSVRVSDRLVLELVLG